MTPKDLEARYRARSSRSWLLRRLEPPPPLIGNPAEDIGAPLGRWNLYLGGAGRSVEGYINVDLVAFPGVTVAADAERLPFADSVFLRVECDAVLEHVRSPESVLAEAFRVLRRGGILHIVTPFCHPYHAYPEDYRRFTLPGLKLLAAGFEVVAEGWRTGPTATLLVFILEYGKLMLPWRIWRIAVHGILGWLLFPLRYLDVLFFRSPRAARIGNHCYLWLRKP